MIKKSEIHWKQRQNPQQMVLIKLDVFSWALFLLFVLSFFNVFVLSYHIPLESCLFASDRKGVDPDGRGVVERNGKEWREEKP